MASKGGSPAAGAEILGTAEVKAGGVVTSAGLPVTPAVEKAVRDKIAEIELKVQGLGKQHVPAVIQKFDALERAVTAALKDIERKKPSAAAVAVGPDVAVEVKASLPVAPVVEFKATTLGGKIGEIVAGLSRWKDMAELLPCLQGMFDQISEDKEGKKHKVNDIPAKIMALLGIGEEDPRCKVIITQTAKTREYFLQLFLNPALRLYGEMYRFASDQGVGTELVDAWLVELRRSPQFAATAIPLISPAAQAIMQSYGMDIDINEPEFKGMNPAGLLLLLAGQHNNSGPILPAVSAAEEKDFNAFALKMLTPFYRRVKAASEEAKTPMSAFVELEGRMTIDFLSMMSVAQQQPELVNQLCGGDNLLQGIKSMMTCGIQKFAGYRAPGGHAASSRQQAAATPHRQLFSLLKPADDAKSIEPKIRQVLADWTDQNDPRQQDFKKCADFLLEHMENFDLLKAIPTEIMDRFIETQQQQEVGPRAAAAAAAS